MTGADVGDVARELVGVPGFSLRRLLAPLWLLTLALAFFWPVVWGQVHLETDYQNWIYPWRYYCVGREAGRCVPLANRLLGDPLFIYAPEDRLLNRSLKRGEIPLWDPYQFCGHPLQAVGHPSMVYPPRLLLHWLLPPLAARETLLFLHLLLGGLFAYSFLLEVGLSRYAALLGGTVWMLGGYAAVYLEFEFVTAACAHVPLAFWLVERTLKTRSPAWAAGLALALGSLILVGHWQYVTYAMLLIVGYCLWRVLQERTLRGTLLLAGAGAAGLALGAVALLPSFELFGESQRPVFSMAQLFGGSRFLPENLATLLLSDALGTPLHHFYLTRIHAGVQTYMDLCGYVGAVPLALAVIGAPRARYLAGAGLVALLYAMGVPGVTLLSRVLPGFSSFSPARTVLIYSLCAALLAAYGMQAFLDGRVSRRLLAGLLVGWLAVTAAVAWFCWMIQTDAGFLQALVVRYLPGGIMEMPSCCTDRAAFTMALLRDIRGHYSLADPYLAAPLVLSGIGFLALYLRASGRLGMTLFRVVFLLAVSADLFYFAVRFSVPFPVVSAYPPAAGLKVLERARAGPFRIAAIHAGMHPDLPTAYRLQAIGGYASMFPSRVSRLVAAMSGHEQNYVMSDLWDARGWTPGLADLLGVRYPYCDPLHRLPKEFGRLVYSGDLNIYWNAGALPRCFLVPRAMVMTRASQVFRQVTARDFDPRRAVYLEQGAGADAGAAGPVSGAGAEASAAGPGAGAGGGLGQVSAIRYTPDRVALTVDASSPCWMVCADAWYPGWQARVDGRPARIYRADYAFRALRLEAGRHSVVMVFRPRSFIVGRAVSLGMLAVCLAVVAIRLAPGIRRSRPA